MQADMIRAPVVAGQFYEGNPTALKRSVMRCIADYTPPDDLGELLGGVVPHAGWVFSGATAAKVFVTLKQQMAPDSFVLFGAVHRHGVNIASIHAEGAWRTPLGEVAIDEKLARAIVEAGGGIVEASARAHGGEHSIEVQVPFIQELCPDARIVPIATPPTQDAVKMGEVVAAQVAKHSKRVAVVASTDLTHYGMSYGMPDHGPWSEAMPWMRRNDRRLIELVEALRAEEVVSEAANHYNACGAGAVAAATAAARALGALSARTLEYTTSADVIPEPHPDRAVGYVGMVFEKAKS